MLSKQQEQQQRLEVLHNDRDLRDQTGTYMSHTHSDAGGRFSAVGAATVIGSTSVPQYPQASAPFQCDPVPPEEPLGYRIEAMPELEPGPLSRAQDTCDLIDAQQGTSQRDVSTPPFRNYRRLR
jgi:hypothetical protein